MVNYTISVISTLSYSPSVSPVVRTSVRSTFVSPMRSGSRVSSAQQVIFMNFPPCTLEGPMLCFGGRGGGVPALSGRVDASSASSNSVNLISSSHSGCWPPRLMALVRRFSLLKETEQYGSCFPMCLLFGRFFCQVGVSNTYRRTRRMSHSF